MIRTLSPYISFKAVRTVCVCAFSPSNTQVPIWSWAASANGPITARVRILSVKGKVSRSFFNKITDCSAASLAFARWAGAYFTCWSVSVYGLSNSPRRNLRRRMLRTASSIAASDTFFSLTSSSRLRINVPLTISMSMPAFTDFVAASFSSLQKPWEIISAEDAQSVTTSPS